MLSLKLNNQKESETIVKELKTEIYQDNKKEIKKKKPRSQKKTERDERGGRLGEGGSGREREGEKKKKF